MEIIAPKNQEIRFVTSPVFKPVFSTDKRYIDIWGGRGRGGSHFGTDYFLFLITLPQYFRGYFVRQAFNDIRDSLFRDFKDRIADNPTIDINDFNIQENEMRILYKPTGNLIVSKGVKKDGNRTAKMKSLAGATHVLMEEADEVGEEDFDQMDISLRTQKVAKLQIIRVFNPPFKQHWIWRDYNVVDSQIPGYFKAIPKAESNVLSIFSTYKSNLRNVNQSTIDKFESFKIKKPEYYWTIIKGLISEGQKGRIFSGWEPITDEDFNNIDSPSIIGVDFGSVTGGIVEEKIVNNRVYLRQLNFGGMTEKAIAFKLAMLGIKDQIVIGDSAEPSAIGKLRRGWQLDEFSEDEIKKYSDENGVFKYPVVLNGFNIFGVVKPHGYRAWSRNKLMDFDVFVTEGSTDLWNEYREHKWALDKNKNPLDEPEDGNDHLIDPSLYVLTSKGRYF
ncbi:MAG: phage terminase large subunit [Bacteroidota bacterium]